ncbi:MAG: excinuclease ABC subunit UvrA, partial [Flavobacteriia bacterium]|nr:excinuclease ABC subunit UvrA [Flavobacteriia bacterium]
NSPKGACETCNGLGIINEINLQKVIPNNTISIKNGGIIPLGDQKNSWIFKQIEHIAERYHFKLTDAIKDIPKEAMEMILHGGNESFQIASKTVGVTRNYKIDFEGIISFIENQHNNAESTSIKRWANSFMDEITCKTCEGKRLKKEALHFKITDKNISDLVQMDITELAAWFEKIEKKLSNKQQQIASEILKEIRTRIQFLVDVGLEYLTLDRTSKSLSGGEAQRIRLATQIGSQLVGVLYILDEPSIGLHQRDNQKLIDSLVKLRDIGNSVLVVEHDKDMIEHADYVIDIGPGAGRHGGQIVSEGTFAELITHHTLTADYLSGKKNIEVPKTRREGNGKFIKLKGASGNNLKNVSVEFPLGKMICV